MPSISSFRRRRGGKGDRRGRGRRSNKYARAARSFGRRARRRRSSRAQARQISKLAGQVGKLLHFPRAGSERRTPRRIVRRRPTAEPLSPERPLTRRRLNTSSLGRLQGIATDATIRSLRLYINARRQAWVDGENPTMDYGAAFTELWNHVQEHRADYRVLAGATFDNTIDLFARLLTTPNLNTADERFERM